MSLFITMPSLDDIYCIYMWREGRGGRGESEEGRGGLLFTCIVHVYIVVGVYVCKW